MENGQSLFPVWVTGLRQDKKTYVRHCSVNEKCFLKFHVLTLKLCKIVNVFRNELFVWRTRSNSAHWTAPSAKPHLQKNI